MVMDYKKQMDKMKEDGMESALIKKGAGLLHSTFNMEDPAPYVSEYLMNNSELLMGEFQDGVREVEIAVDGGFMVLVPLGDHVLIALIKTREEKKGLLEHIKSIKSALDGE